MMRFELLIIISDQNFPTLVPSGSARVNDIVSLTGYTLENIQDEILIRGRI